MTHPSTSRSQQGAGPSPQREPGPGTNPARAAESSGPEPRRPGRAAGTNPKAAAAVANLRNHIHERAAQAPRDPLEISEEAKPDHGKQGRFERGRKKTGGRRPGSKNKIPSGAKQVMRMLVEGSITVHGKVAAHVFATNLIAGMQVDPPHSKRYLDLFAEYGIGKPTPPEGNPSGERRMSIILTGPIRDPLAKPGDPPKPLRLLGQVWGPNGDIIEFKTGKVVMTAEEVKRRTPAKAAPRPEPEPEDDGLGTGEDRLEVVDDVHPPPTCPTGRGRGRLRTGFGDRTEPCSQCGGRGTA